MINLLEKFKEYKIGIENIKEKTVDQYIYNINGFLELYGITDDGGLISMTTDDVQNWLLKLAKEGNCPSTRNTKLTAVKTIYSFIKRYNKLAKSNAIRSDKIVKEFNAMEIDDEILNIKCAKVPIKEPRVLDKKEAFYFIEDITNQRTKACVAVDIATGLRYAEMVTLTVSDIKRGWAIINGKGNKERTVYFPPWCIDIVNKYINGKRKHIIDRLNIETDLLFISDYGNTLSRNNYAESLKHYAKRCGIDWANAMSPHKLRHSAATIWHEKGYDVKEIQKGLGHANLVTTSRYVHEQKQKTRSMMLEDL